MASNQSLATRLRKAREKRQWTQADLAKKAGFQPSAISQFETGQREPSAENLRKLAQALGVSVDSLLTGDSAVRVSGPQMKAVVRYAQAMSGDDLEMLKDFAALLAKKAKARGEPDADKD